MKIYKFEDGLYQIDRNFKWMIVNKKTRTVHDANEYKEINERFDNHNP